MKAIDCIRTSLIASKGMLDPLIDDMQDAPLAQPTPNGGNHPLWVLGHLAYGEGQLLHVHIHGGENPLAEWKDLFDAGSEPTTDADAYPTYQEIRDKFETLRVETMAFVDSLTGEDLDRPSKSCPPGMEPFFGTIGKCLLMLGLHTMNHRGQIADARRAIGRKRRGL